MTGAAWERLAAAAAARCTHRIGAPSSIGILCHYCGLVRQKVPSENPTCLVFDKLRPQTSTSLEIIRAAEADTCGCCHFASVVVVVAAAVVDVERTERKCGASKVTASDSHDFPIGYSTRTVN
jgi:hypothetical protein